MSERLDRYSLDVDDPQKIPVVLETTANYCRELAQGAVSWAPGNGSAIWADIAEVLGRAANECKGAFRRRFGVYPLP